MAASSGGVKCPTCKGPVAAAAGKRDKFFPFCSERCQLIDLGRWLDEDYRVPDQADVSGGGVGGVKDEPD